MDELTAQTSEQTLPGLVHITLEHLRNLRLKGPPTFQHEHYAQVWQYLGRAGNELIDRIEDLRWEGHERWETGDEASIQLFGRNGVPQGKEFLRNVMRGLASLGTTSHLSSAPAITDTQRFDPDQVPRLQDFEEPGADVNMEDFENHAKKDDIKEEEHEKETIEPKAIKTEAVEASPQDPVLPSIEGKSFPIAPGTSTALMQRTATTNSFKTPTVPRPADYKTPPRGPSFSPITPPPPPPSQAVADTNSNDPPNTGPSHSPLQYPDDQRFQNHLSTIDFNYDDDGPHSLFEFPTPTDVQKELSPPPPPQHTSQPGQATTAAAILAEQEYMASVRLVLANLRSLVYLMRPV